ncbi:hypothetical protein HU200_020011 [Digitaria exilis]|uniref:Uncharacterized protein n=1 Tax=Digitaria exilis TaxID=1010633 RepID=A0A835F189_9POAL|nr:hypothetical protein HU200_020011 [Digitaria exilis]
MSTIPAFTYKREVAGAGGDAAERAHCVICLRHAGAAVRADRRASVCILLKNATQVAEVSFVTSKCQCSKVTEFFCNHFLLLGLETSVKVADQLRKLDHSNHRSQVAA